MWAILSLLVGKGRAHRARGRGFRPRVEALEDRYCLSPGVMEWSDPEGGGANAVAVQPDGKTVVAGVALNSKVQQFIFVQRLNQDGSVDLTFNKSGSLTIQTGKGCIPSAVALQPDGKILIGGQAIANNGTGESLVARVNPNGTLDTTFGNSRGLELLTNGGYVDGLAVLTDPTHPATVTGIVAAVYTSCLA
jgi:uncharacterized delta-60 repeat protein